MPLLLSYDRIRKLFVFLLFLLFFAQMQAEETELQLFLKKIIQEGGAYQDIIINDEVVLKGWGPNCASRYAAIQPLLSRYQRPITVLDIGANHGYFSLRIAHDYPTSTCVMVDFNERLLPICCFNTERNNLIFLQQALSAQELRRLSECEHFDIVLALNVLHHMHPWQDCLKAIFELGDQILIETPPANDAVVPDKPTVPEIEEYLLSLDGTVLTRTERYLPGTYASLFWFSRTKGGLKRKSWQEPPQENSFFLQSNYLCKRLFRLDEERDWLAGINLCTFEALHGCFPLPSWIEMYRKQLLQTAPNRDKRLLLQGYSLSILP